MCCSFHLPKPGQSKDFQLCIALKPSNETTLNALKCFNERSRKSSTEGLYVCAAGLKILKIDELHWFIVFHISICGTGSFVWGTNHKVAHADETESRAAQWWGHTWDWSWNLWLKWLKANNKRESDTASTKDPRICRWRVRNPCFHWW